MKSKLSTESKVSSSINEALDEKTQYYTKIIEDLGVEQLFDDLIQNDTHKKPFEDPVFITEGKHSNEKHGYRVNMKELKIGKVPHHEIMQEWGMSHTPWQYSVFFAFENIKDRVRQDDQINLSDNLFYMTKNNIFYTFTRQTTKKILVMKGKELIYVNAYKQLENGDVAEIY